MKRHFTLFALVMATVMTAGAATLTKTATPFKADKKSMPKANIVLNKFRRQRNVQRHRASQKSH